ncbi:MULTISPECIES: SGNH/GDSL hydrolase family protein [Spirulina sp. CCY15215]|uniref:SGNH/GDSL hydrolase family protein n=1 Tax=Spirulina sp. CCY15215 TaxID=2767591 RepID=UPI00194EF572|nr:SGNH/GDSL hydrolase family protein [Spirulina major]
MKLKTVFRYRFLIFIILLVLILEGVLRLKFGLGNPVLSQTDSATGYRFQPNQNITRFGRKIIYNQYSQRSDRLTSQNPKNTLRILMVGDSVLNGGTLTDQKQTISEQLEAQIKKTGINTEVLNASAGSWGIGNQLGYLQKFGTFASDLLILQIGTHDLIQPTSVGDRVGIDPNYPDHKPFLALQEMFSRYLLPQFSLRLHLQPPYPEIPPTLTPEEQFHENLLLLDRILKRDRTLPIIVLFTPNRVDVLPNADLPAYKTKFLQFLKTRHISFIDTHLAWSQYPATTTESYFRDVVHLTPAGNSAIAKLLFEQICQRDRLCSL